MKTRKIYLLYFLPFFIVGFFPIINFIINGMISTLISENVIGYIIMDERKWVLLFKTIFYGLGVVIFGLLVGTVISIGIIGLNKINQKRILVIIASLIPIPQCIYTLVWMQSGTNLNRFLGTELIFTGWGISLFVQTVSLLPIIILILFFTMKSIPSRSIQMGRMIASDGKVFIHVWLNECKYGFIISGVILFMMTINDYGVPSTFAINTYAMEIFSKYSISLDVRDALAASLPMFIIGFILSLLLVKVFENRALNGRIFEEDRFVSSIPLLRYGSMFVTVLLVGVFMIVPVLIVFTGGDFIGNGSTIYQDGGQDILMTILICGLAALFSLPIILMAAYGVSKTSGFRRYIILVMIMMPLMMSPSLIGASLIYLWNVEWLRSIYTSIMLPIHGIMIRFMPLGVLVVLLGIRKIPNETIAIGHMLSGTDWKILFKIIIPDLWPLLLLASGWIFLLGFGELGTTIMLLPPGVSTISVRIYGYLHYGATEMISELGMIIILFQCTLLLILLKIVDKYYTRRSR